MNEAVQAARRFARQREAEFRARETELGRKYLIGIDGVSDVVDEKEEQAYREAAVGVSDIELHFDRTGEMCGREVPAEGHAYAIVIGDSEVYWGRVDQLLGELEEVATD